LTEDPVRPREIDQRIPEGLELVIQRAMAKDANDRFSSMQELEAALLAREGTAGGGSRGSMAVIPSVRELAAASPSDPRIQATGAQRAFDMAKTVLGSDSVPPPAQATAKL